MTAFLQCFTQDSLRNVHVPAWKLSRMIDEVNAGRICDTLVNKLSQTVDSLKVALTAGQALIDVRTEERDLKVKESQLWESRFENKEALQKIELKRAKDKGNKKGLAGVVVGILIGIALL